MSSEFKTYCDRCGEEVRGRMHIEHRMEFNVFNLPLAKTHGYYDLCNECAKEFEKFISCAKLTD